jgi:hypothetical protein
VLDLAQVKRENARRRGGVISVHVRGHSNDTGNDRADEPIQWEEMAGPYCRLSMDNESDVEKLARRSR